VRAGQIEVRPSNHLQCANLTDKNVVSYTKSEADYISYHAANFEENAINTTGAWSQIRSVEILYLKKILNLKKSWSRFESQSRSLSFDQIQIPIPIEVKITIPMGF
jgi:hypothetical protein